MQNSTVDTAARESPCVYEREPLPFLLSVNATRRACGNRGRGWVYERLSCGDFESVVEGGRRLIVTSTVLAFIDRLRAGNGQKNQTTAETAAP